MRKLITILLILVSLNVSAKKCNHIFKGSPYAWMKSPLPPVDYLNLPLYPTGQPGWIADGRAKINSGSPGTITGYKFFNAGSTNNGHGLWLDGRSNVTIEYCTFDSTTYCGIYASGGSNITIQYCLFINCNVGFRTDGTDGIKLLNNQFINMIWLQNEQGCCRGQLIQFANITPGSGGNHIKGNRAENFFGESYNEDLVNNNNSSGIAGDSILVMNNVFRGGNPSVSGGGILAGDGNGSYLAVRSNILINPGQYGFGVAGGTRISVTNNRDFSSGLAWAGSAYYALSLYGGCTDVVVGSTNTYNWEDYDGGQNAINTNTTPGNYPCYAPGGGGVASPTFDAGITEASLLAITGPIITFLTENEIWQVRARKVKYALLMINGDDYSTHVAGQTTNGVNLRRPTAAAGSDQTITASTATLSASASTADNSAGAGTNTLNGYHWVQVSGPNTATMSASTSSTNNLSGMITGTYVFRLEVEQNNSQFGYKTYHADWVTINTTVTATGVKAPVKIAYLNNDYSPHDWTGKRLYAFK